MARRNISGRLLPILAVVAILVSAGIVLWTQPDRAMAQPERTPPAAPSGERGIVAGSGVIEPASELVEIAAEIPGIVDKVHVRPGDRVEPGAPLFSVDSRSARAAVAEAEARVQRLRSTVAAARTSLSVARRQYALYADAGDPRAFSRQEVIARQGAAEEGSAQLSVAEGQLREALAQLQSARVTLARHTVTAPIAATVLQVRTRAGEFAPAGQQGNGNQDPLIVLGDTDPLHVRIDIDENEIERLAIGSGATISPRGAADRRTAVTFVRAEPLVVPKRSLTNASSERVDVRVLQLVFALPADARGYFVGQQVDGFVKARGAK